MIRLRVGGVSLRPTSVRKLRKYGRIYSEKKIPEIRVTKPIERVNGHR